jgi:PAS domain S-box-containing protein
LAATFLSIAYPLSQTSAESTWMLDVNRESPERSVLDQAEQLAQTGSWDWDLDEDVLLWSDNLFRLFGLEPGEIAPSRGYVVGRIHPDDREQIESELSSAEQTGTLPPITYRITWPDDSVHVLRALSAVVEEHEDRPARLVGSVQDITELAGAQRHMAESLTLLETLQATAPVGFAFVDREFRIVRINQSLADINGAAPEDQIGRTVAEMAPDLWPQVGPLYRQVLETGEPVFNVEVEGKTNGSQNLLHWIASFYPVSIDKEMIGVGVAVLDVTEREEAAHFRSAVMDTMVEGLYVLDSAGRLTFMNAAASKILGWSDEELRGKPMHTAIHFQHADGSPHLENDSELLKVRTEGRSVRMGHEAFTRKNGTICPVSYSAAPLLSGTSVRGVVVVFRDTSLEHADEDRVKRGLDTLAWVGRIRDALDEDRLTLFSQPVVPLRGGQPSQELLLRMLGTAGEIIPPGSFLPVAERYGLIGEIDRWVIGEAIRFAASGQRVEANLSAESISHLDLLPLIERELRDANTDPSNVVFEITETALMENVEAGEAFARALTAIGCQVALDDFGTGFGSFTYLKNLPITYLKIDVDFVLDLVTNRANQHLVRAIVGLAHDFGYQTIAEGVEDAETLALLDDYGVDFAQGFHLGCPAPIESSPAPAA